MANFSLVVNSKFNPFSFERYIQPYQIYGQAYREVENTLGELDTKASIWEEMANEQTDPYAYKMYKTYANDLEEQAGQLAREGLNAASRRNMLNMRARYSKEITPIEQAYALRQKQAEQQQQALLQDPTLMLSRRAATTSLDDYIRNPQLAYEAYSGKLITAQAATAAAALAKQMRDNPRKWRSILHDSYYETLMQRGFKTEDVLKAIQGHPEAAQELTRIVEDAVNSSGVRNWGDKATIARAIDYAKQGLWSAVGETQYQVLDNWRAKMAAQEAMQKRAEARAEARAAKNKAPDNDLNYKPRTLEHLNIAKENLSSMTKTMNTMTRGGKPLAAYFGKRGNINPLKLYEEYRTLVREYKPVRGAFGPWGGTNVRSNAEGEAKAALRKKYGNIRIITADEYNNLKSMGYSNQSKLRDFYGMQNKINNAASAYVENFINGVDLDYITGVINNNVTSMAKNKRSFANVMTPLDSKFNATSKKFDPDDYGTDTNPIVDLSHSVKFPKKFIATYKDGSKVLVNPNVISGEAQSLVNAYDARKQELLKQGYGEQEVNDYLEPYLMQGFVNLGLRGYNASASKTDSKVN